MEPLTAYGEIRVERFSREHLWRTLKAGLDDTEQETVRDMLQLPNDSDIDPLLVRLRILMRWSVYEDVSKNVIHKLFPDEVLLELRRSLTLLLQKFQMEWREEVMKDQVIVQHSKTMTWSMAEQEVEPSQPVKLQTNAVPQPRSPCILLGQ